MCTLFLWEWIRTTCRYCHLRLMAAHVTVCCMQEAVTRWVVDWQSRTCLLAASLTCRARSRLKWNRRLGTGWVTPSTSPIPVPSFHPVAFTIKSASRQRTSQIRTDWDYLLSCFYTTNRSEQLIQALVCSVTTKRYKPIFHNDLSSKVVSEVLAAWVSCSPPLVYRLNGALNRSGTRKIATNSTRKVLNFDTDVSDVFWNSCMTVM